MPGTGTPHGAEVTLQDMIQMEALDKWMEGFLRDCRVRELSPYTIKYYKAQLADFAKFARAHAVSDVPDITPDLIRSYMLHLAETGHNPGGRRTKYIALRAFLNWYQAEAEPIGWANPTDKVKPPKVDREPIKGARLEDIRAMLATCYDGFLGVRDRALLLALLDTGARAGEFIAVNLEDVDTIAGAVILRHTKARKPRTVFLGRKARKALRAYLKTRRDNCPALWVSRRGDRLAVKSLHGLLNRRGRLAHLKETPSAHDFRRAHALMMLRAGTDVITPSRLMGHATLEVLRRYLAQSADDLQAAHERASPADKVL
jgi:integrase/recombinase XerD